MNTFNHITDFIRQLYDTNQFIPLHEPCFTAEERRNLLECIDSTIVSSVGGFVDKFEEKICDFTGASHAVAVVNGTQALQMALHIVGANNHTEVITQALTFVATPNAIKYTGAIPVFIDVDQETFGLSPEALQKFLEQHTTQKKNKCWNRITERQIIACVPVHTFGHPCKINEIHEICKQFNIFLIEDAAESLGSWFQEKHTGRFGELGIFSFNGNKIITTGGGGVIITDNMELARRCRHLTTTAKVPHPWEFLHDEIGYNFRMPNLNAALGVAQMEKLPDLLIKKHQLMEKYQNFFRKLDIQLLNAPDEAQSNFWLQTIFFEDQQQRDGFLEYSNQHGVMTRAIWKPMHQLPMYQDCQRDNMMNTLLLYQRAVNIPSSVTVN